MELIKFTFENGWHFAGTILILHCILNTFSEITVNIIKAVKNGIKI